MEYGTIVGEVQIRAGRPSGHATRGSASQVVGSVPGSAAILVRR
jgi:hypothetical protein